MSHPVWSGPSDSELRPLEVIRAHWVSQKRAQLDKGNPLLEAIDELANYVARCKRIDSRVNVPLCSYGLYP